MSDINLTIICHRGEALPLGRNVAIKLLLEKSSADKMSNDHRVLSAVREFWVRSFCGHDRFNRETSSSNA
jgi:hypothetical protein